MKIRETTEKADNLIEQGEQAKQNQMRAQQNAMAARSQLHAAYAQLDAASETDEEGEPTGDVAGARAAIYAAQAMLQSAEHDLADATRQIDSVNREKQETIAEIERYQEAEGRNVSVLQQLQSKRFGGNATSFAQDILSRMNAGENARQQLLASLGMSAAAKTFSIGGAASSAGLSGSTSSLGGSLQDSANAKPILGGLFEKRKHDHSQRVSTINFNGFTLENNGMSGDKYYVKGNNYERFAHFWQNTSQYSHSEVSGIRTVNARDIEGIYLYDHEAHDPHLFWNRDKEYEIDSETYFMEVATHIPEVRSRLEAGVSAEEIRNDPRLATCYDYYFDSPIEVYEVDDFYYFAHSGRHRCMAAQKLGYDIPVKVIGKYEKKPNDVRTQSIHDFNSLASYMNTNYGIQLDSSINHLELTTVKDAISGIEKVVNEYPDVGTLLNKGVTSYSGVMSCTGTELSFNPAYFADKLTLAEKCKELSNKKVWISNASPHTIGVHEAAHGVEWALIQANTQYKTDYERVAAWNNCTEAKLIVEQACRNIKKTPYGQNKSITELVRSISAYALTSNSETMAESFADVDANGDNANPLSIEIKRLTKERMNQYKGGN